MVYDHLDLAAEQAGGNLVTWQSDGVSYQMVRNDTLPLLAPLRWVGLGAVAAALDAPLREKIEASYDRPSTQSQAGTAGASAVSAVRAVRPAPGALRAAARTGVEHVGPTREKRAHRGA